MPFVELWDLSAADARAFADAYWDARDVRLGEFATLSGLDATGTRASLVEGLDWAIRWWLRDGATEEGGAYPMWFLPPTLPRHESELRAPALRLADALGYLWLCYGRAQLPGLHHGLCAEKTLSFQQPSVWIDPQRTTCPFSWGYNQLLGIREDSPVNKQWRAGRDPERLAQLADSWIATTRRELSANASAAPPLSGRQRIDLELRDLGLSLPLHTIYIDDERNAGAIGPDGEEISVVFDDVSAYEFEDEIDQLVDHLAGLHGITEVEREDREFILVELAPGTTATSARGRLDAAADQFMRDALTRRWPS